ncbi:nitrite reductase (NADH) small subunit [Inhella inkyongensis]|uniref:Nitrite reductase (NADH) small subunit n=1 Tax=Inhella inkyongensis TaxID=392593 RepID=A0A840S3H8_9BURK|nr:nitrite reductase small subunit NirD [Inhella inkyongensis]MBB5203120.1 nitrite reductase (NADH) small subunit [Inhella inkyongensis]
MNTWKPICHLHDIPLLGARRVARARGMDVALFRTANDEVFALLDRCPHKGGPLSQGLVFGRSVACPLHHWTIGLASGQAHAPDEGCTPVFQVQVVEGVIQLLQQELDEHALDLAPPVAGPCAKRIAIIPNPAPA